nr:LCP family protein [Lysinibacillus timonensis]
MEENQLHESQPSRKHNRRRRARKGRVVFILLFIIVISIVTYIIFQYRSGLELASVTKMHEESFIPDEAIDHITNYLIIGIDTRGEEQSRSDTMMLLSINNSSKEIKLVSFMRDIYAEIPGYESYKLNTAYFLGGIQLLKDTISTMFEVPIHHYALIDFKSFESLIDILSPEGIEMEVEKDMSAHIGVSLKKGVQKLNGKELLGYSRFRQDEEGDFGRVERQQKVIEAIKNELLSPTNILKLPKLLGAAQGYVTTDMSTAEEVSTALSIALGGEIDIQKLTIPVEGTYSFAYYEHAGSVIEIDKAANRNFLHEFINFNK